MLIALCAILIALILFRLVGVRLLVAIAQAFLFGAMMLLGVCVGIHSAFAADSNTIALSPLVTFLGPVVSQIIVALVMAVLGLLAAVLKRYLTKVGVNLSDDQWAVVQRTAAHWAAQWWAKEDASLATAQITVANPQVATYANFAIEEIPQIAKALNLTPAKMGEFIVAEIGKLQAKVTTVAVPAGAKP